MTYKNIRIRQKKQRVVDFLQLLCIHQRNMWQLSEWQLIECRIDQGVATRVAGRKATMFSRNPYDAVSSNLHVRLTHKTDVKMFLIDVFCCSIANPNESKFV